MSRDWWTRGRPSLPTPTAPRTTMPSTRRSSRPRRPNSRPPPGPTSTRSRPNSRSVGPIWGRGPPPGGGAGAPRGPAPRAAPPDGSRSDATDVERYHEMAEQFGAVERRQLTCAMHVHVEIDSDDEGVRVAARIGPWLPVLTALSANSPFHNARDTGYASYRRVVWGEWPTSGPAGPFADADDYHRTVRDLIATGAARDDGMIYFDVRLSANFPTLEVRICDVTRDVEDAAALAALCRGLVSTAADDDHAAPARVELLRAAHWRAARYGMTERLVDLTNGRPRLVPAWDLAHALADHTAVALETAGDTDRVRSALER